MRQRIPWPTLHAGITPDDLPYGYSAYGNVWDDLSGYEPIVTGCETNEDSRQVIIVSLSPGRYLSCTMVSAGHSVEQSSELVRSVLGHLRSSDAVTGVPAQPGSARAPEQGSANREAVQ